MNKILENYFTEADNCKILHAKAQSIIYHSKLVNQKKYRLVADDHMLILVLNGSKRITTPELHYQVSKGEGIFIRKDSIIVLEDLYENYQSESLTFILKDDYMLDFVERHNQILSPSDLLNVRSLEIYQFQIDTLLGGYTQSLLSHLEQPNKKPKELIELKLNELWFTLVLGQEKSYFTSLLRTISKDNHSSLEEILSSNLYRSLNVEYLAFLSNKSLSQFKREFKLKYNDTPANWIRKKKLEKASRLLMTTDKSIGEISNESGFVNVSHFCKLFQKHYKSSPLKYRKTMPD